MLRKLRILFSIIVIGLAIFSMVTGNHASSPFLMLFLSAAILMTGLIELQKDKKAFWGYMSIGVSLFVFFVSIQGFVQY
ncbi:DUF3953 domain-containing protein [Alkalihalobacterium elongatum]|uniref:DUF3953 domain-containing protein n=1 Tax=Alkalihalobacterium elongatum TaxID=2675466 RepID=UPI001C1FA9F5|nr:DUF3953 domain-containing protein [Alkalihalobacterium elongatum]